VAPLVIVWNHPAVDPIFEERPAQCIYNVPSLAFASAVGIGRVQCHRIGLSSVRLGQDSASDVQDHRPERVGTQRLARRSPRMYANGLMFCSVARGMLASMSGIDSLNGRDVGVMALLPTGTVTLLLADVEGSTRLWQTQAEVMTAAIATLDRTLSDVVTAHHGVRPIEQGEGDSFVVAFTSASDAVACALALQRAPLSPMRLRIGLHTGEVQLRDEGNYIGSTINRTGRLRDMAHGGQTLLSGTASDLAIDQLPSDAWLTDLGSHVVRDLPRPEHVMQLCHSDVLNEFPPLRTSDGLAAQHLPVQLTSFVGREAQTADVRGLIGADRLVTLTGAGVSVRPAWQYRLPPKWRLSSVTACGMSIWHRSLTPRSCLPPRHGLWVCRISRVAPRWTACSDSSVTGTC
jgi:class 3 adenylate cyclase